jgi:hypothetical protein
MKMHKIFLIMLISIIYLHDREKDYVRTISTVELTHQKS